MGRKRSNRQRVAEGKDLNGQARVLFSDPRRLKGDEVGAERLGEGRLLEWVQASKSMSKLQGCGQHSKQGVGHPQEGKQGTERGMGREKGGLNYYLSTPL